MASDGRKPISTRTRYTVLNRDGYTCQACGAKAPDVTLHIDHRLPLARGGSDDIENLQALCSACNLGKSDAVLDAQVTVETPVQEPGKHPLVGWAFLSYRTEDGNEVCEWQGEIRAVLTTNSPLGDVALVDFFDWLGGHYTYSQGIPVSDFAKPWGSRRFFKLFQTHTERNDYYNWKHGQAARAWGDES